jgi:hypothetical protein
MCDSMKRRFQEWQEWWNGDDENSVHKQIYWMMRNAAVFEVFREGAELAWKRSQQSAPLDWAVLDFMRFGYLDLQVAAISRLLDKRKDVTSLARLVDEIKGRCACLTRENILSVRGLSSEFGTGLGNAHSSDGSIGSEQHERVEYANRRIDELAGVSDGQRKPTDTVRLCVLDWLEARLHDTALKEIVQYRHKFVAHASDPKSRKKKRKVPSDFQMCFSKVEQAHEIICQTAAFLGENILGGSPHLPHAEDVFEHWDKPLILDQDKDAARNNYEEYRRKAKGWLSWEWQTEFNSCARD